MSPSIAFHAVRMLLAVAALLAAPSLVFAQAEVSATPSVFSAGARIKVYSEGLVGSTNYRLRLEQQRPGVQTWDLADFNSGTSRQATTTVVVPNVAAATYDLVLYRVALGLTAVASTTVTVVPSLGVVPTPTSAAPGKSVRLSVTNLSAGSLRVLYAGTTVLGPVAVAEGTWIGKFVVPRDRPATLPASVPVVVENLVGRTVVKRGAITFNALAPSLLPRLGLNLTSQPTTTIDAGARFMVGGTLRTDDGVAPLGRQSMYFRDAGGRTIPLDAETTIAADGSFAMAARAPDPFRDGYLAIGDRVGDLLVVNRGTDVHTDSALDGIGTASSRPQATIDGRDAGGVTFTVEVLGDQPGSEDPPVPGVYVEAQQDYQHSFGFGIPGSSDGVNDEQAFMSFSDNQLRNLRNIHFPPPSVPTYGCDITVFRRRTNDSGIVTFTFNPDSISQTNVVQIAADCFSGNCSDQPAGASKGGGAYGLAAFSMWIYAANAGYRSRGIALGYDGDTGQIINVETGQALPGNRLVVRLEPTQVGDFDLRNLRIDGLGGPAERPAGECAQGQAGKCYYQPFVFGGMYTYPDTARWPSTPDLATPYPNNVFDALNVGRKVRLAVDPAVTGSLTLGRIRVGNSGWANFAAASGTPACTLESTTPVEYVASLPDLTRLPAAGVTLGEGGIATGGIDGEIELRFGTSPLRTIPFKLGTRLPPEGLEVGNPNIASLRINALTDRLYGQYNVADETIPVGSPGQGIRALNNATTNDGDFDFSRTPDGAQAQRLASKSDNQVAGRDGGPREREGSGGLFFGFTDDTHTTPEPLVLFDTGIIPLFRYTWGLPPLAEATLGADFWMASELAFYGEMRTRGMNATIDPTVKGGVDLFFDLDVLLGLASASIRAETEIGVNLRRVVNDGGKFHLGITQQSGKCFGFDLDAVWEACAVGICEGGREELIREREPNDCALPAAAKSKGFDLARPRYTATAMANDGRGNIVTVGLRADGALVANHLSGSVVLREQVIAALPVAVQHIDVAYYGANRALAVWSENRRSAADVRSLMLAQRGAAFDDLVRTQRLRFAVWDGSAWSAPADLTSGGNDGKPQLAACLASARSITFECPLGGEVTAVWERDANANLDAPDIEVWSATWTPAGGWTRVARVSNTGTSSDMLPSVAYRNGTPIVAWAHNPAGHFTNLGGRRVAYRFLDGSPQVVATALGSGVGWVSIGVSPADAVVIAYTRAQDVAGFVGNRQALASARATTCSAGVCNFLVTEPRDASGRQFRVERPSVAFDDDGTPMIGFRGLGFGPTAGGEFGLPGDAPGMLLGTGELGMVRVHSFALSTYTAQLVNLSGNGLQHWKPEFAFDAAAGAMIATSMQAAPPPGGSAPIDFAKQFSPDGFVAAAGAKALPDGAVLRVMDGGPDFTLRDLALSRQVVSAGQALQLTLSLVNEGQAYDPAVHGPVQVVAAWNAPPGAGIAAGSFTLSTLQASNSSRAVSIALAVPTGIRNDERQTLFVEVVAGEDANASTGPADRWRLMVNEMPVPTGVYVDTRRDSPFVNITWTNPNDARVAGWRVWKRDAQGAWRHLGSSNVAGYLDFTGTPGTAVQYRVASYSANGMESEPSETAMGRIEQSLPDALFGNGFEPAAAAQR